MPQPADLAKILLADWPEVRRTTRSDIWSVQSTGGLGKLVALLLLHYMLPMP